LARIEELHSAKEATLETLIIGKLGQI